MKICLINNLFTPYERGGADRVAEIVYRGLSRRGHKMFSISLRPLFSKPKNIPNRYYLPSMFFNLNSIPKLFRFFYHMWDFVNFINVLKIALIFHKKKPDLVITNNLKGVGYLTFWLLRVLKITNIHILHDIQLIHPSGLMIYEKEKKLDSIFSAVYSRLSRVFCASPEFVISPSKWLLSLHKEHRFFKKSNRLILPNPVEFKNVKITSSYRKNKISKFLYVGEITPHKGVDFLILTFLSLLKERGDLHLSIIGRGSEKLIIPNRQRENFCLQGWKNKKEVEQEMIDSDCLIVPSLCYENSPTVIYEAATTALPVIASRIGGISELVHSLGGVLFNPGDKADLRKKIIYTLKNPDIINNIGIRSSRNIDKYAVEKYLDFLEKN